MMQSPGNNKELMINVTAATETDIRFIGLARRTLFMAVDGAGVCSATFQLFGTPSGDKKHTAALTSPIVLTGTPIPSQSVMQVEKIEIECANVFLRVSALTGSGVKASAWIEV